MKFFCHQSVCLSHYCWSTAPRGQGKALMRNQRPSAADWSPHQLAARPSGLEAGAACIWQQLPPLRPSAPSCFAHEGKGCSTLAVLLGWFSLDRRPGAPTPQQNKLNLYHITSRIDTEPALCSAVYHGKGEASCMERRQACRTAALTAAARALHHHKPVCAVNATCCDSMLA